MSDRKGCVLVKLTTGEQVMCIIHAERQSEIDIIFPMLIRQNTMFDKSKGRMVDQITAVPWCQFTHDKFFTLGKDKIVFKEPLHELVVPQYIDMVRMYEQEVSILENEDGSYDIAGGMENHPEDWLANQVHEDDVEFDNVTQIEKAIDNIQRKMLQQEDDEKQLDLTNVSVMKGNDTIN